LTETATGETNKSMIRRTSALNKYTRQLKCIASTGECAKFRAMATEAKPDIKTNLEAISAKVRAAYDAADPAKRAAKVPRLLAVSKVQPKELVIEAYEAGHRDFGENYIQVCGGNWLKLQ
jgi:hypothetical protein